MSQNIIAKQVRKSVSFTSIGVIIYNIIMYAVVLGCFFLSVIYIGKTNPAILASDKLYNDFVTKTVESGTSSIISLFIGFLFLLLFFHKDKPLKGAFSDNNKMTLVKFLSFIPLTMMFQLVFSVFSSGLETLLNGFGYSVMDSIESASSTSQTLSMFLYAAIFAPIFEEVIYRGFVLHSLQKSGKIFAIVLSALFFGFMHANIVQGFYAFFLGLLFGYIATEYSLKWTILLHMINNMVFGEFLSYAMAPLSEDLQSVITGFICMVLFGIGLIILAFKYQHVVDYFTFNRTEKKFYKYAFCSVFFIIFVVLEIIMGVQGITTI